MATLSQIRCELSKEKTRSAWGKGVLSYADELIDNIDLYEVYRGLHDIDYPAASLDNIMLNGATSWNEYSYNGNSYVYDEDIAKTLCTPSELIRFDNGRKQPSKNKTWLDLQARALFEAAYLIKGIAWNIDYQKGAQL